MTTPGFSPTPAPCSPGPRRGAGGRPLQAWGQSAMASQRRGLGLQDLKAALGEQGKGGPACFPRAPPNSSSGAAGRTPTGPTGCARRDVQGETVPGGLGAAAGQSTRGSGFRSRSGRPAGRTESAGAGAPPDCKAGSTAARTGPGRKWDLGPEPAVFCKPVPGTLRLGLLSPFLPLRTAGFPWRMSRLGAALAAFRHHVSSDLRQWLALNELPLPARGGRRAEQQVLR